ncbi:MAG: DegV family EDD domain-containing protein [Desulfobacterales bacterium]|nr:DegV family EDD domain-containing protein [Desulfobacterales bacterium]
MDQNLQMAFICGVERVAAWSDLLDQINVFPVADGDTGRNLIISLTPLRRLALDKETISRNLMLSARGNSGNIATQFFSGLLKADSTDSLPQAVKIGKKMAWKAINDPVQGTMLTVFDALVDVIDLGLNGNPEKRISKIIDHLEQAVQSTPELLPALKHAGVVDSGALGMFIYLEGFFKSLINQANNFRPIQTVFKGKLQISSSFQEKAQNIFCVDTVIQSNENAEEKIKQLSSTSSNVVVIPYEKYLKVHLHTQDSFQTRKLLESVGEVVQWSEDHIGNQVKAFKSKTIEQAIHIMTDAAGSVTREDSHKLGITLLDSYITVGQKSLPETFFTPSELYASMRNGEKVSTSQASVFERHQYYQSVLHQYGKALYLCVGSVYTGNYEIAMKWKEDNDPDNCLFVIDTGTASGRLGAIVISTAKFSAGTDDPDAVIAFAHRAVQKCEEYVFLDKLKYLAAGGRLSKTSAFFGDILKKKPVISPLPEGASKAGILQNSDEQLVFALEKLNQSIPKDSSPFIMLEYSDNKDWVSDVVINKIQNHYPSAEITLQPLSLTSGAHMGPGTWAIAFLPENV